VTKFSACGLARKKGNLKLSPGLNYKEWNVMVNDLEKKVGQLLMVGIPDPQITQKDLNLLNRIGVGGIILFQKNCESIEQICELTNTLQKRIAPEAYKALPCFIGIDHEGGRVQRIKEPFTVFPPMAELGKLNSAKSAFEVGYVMGKELRAVGVNLNFSPVVDVPYDMNTDGLWDRAFSTDPEVVANMGSAVVRGIQKGGCIGVLKHFPGHGSVNLDSHMDLPVCSKRLEEMSERHWLPFRKGLRARAEGVMTAHIIVESIDSEKPATFSRKVIQDYLRKDLRHSKLIFSDDLEMGAVKKRYELQEAAFLAVQAGCDVVLLCHDYAQVEEVWRHLVKAFEGGVLSEARLDETLKRIEATKEKFLLPMKYVDVELAKAIVGAPSFREVARSIREGQAVESGPSTQVG